VLGILLVFLFGIYTQFLSGAFFFVIALLVATSILPIVWLNIISIHRTGRNFIESLLSFSPVNKHMKHTVYMREFTKLVMVIIFLIGLFLAPILSSNDTLYLALSVIFILTLDLVFRFIADNTVLNSILGLHYTKSNVSSNPEEYK
jgi:hypothetical protein